MHLSGAIDGNVTIVPDLDGFEVQPYMRFFLQPFSVHEVRSYCVRSTFQVLTQSDGQVGLEFGQFDRICFHRILVMRRLMSV